ncbi:MAG: ABC transporter permease [Saccharofermentanales bacterium]
MSDNLIYITIALFIASAIRVSIPLLLGTLGETLTERVGNLNLGVEGLMLMGSAMGFLVAVKTESLFLAILGAMLAAGFGSFLYGILTITLRANQVVTGLALTIFGTGFANTLGKSVSSSKTPKNISEIFAKKPLNIDISGIENIPVLGPVAKFISTAFLQHNISIYIVLLLAAVITIFLYKTRAGLKMRSVGENPYAADSAGINVILTKYIYVVFGGALCGLAGLYMSLIHIGVWIDNITAGRGWIVVALVIFVRWDPLKAILGSFIFGALEVLKFYLDIVPGLKDSIFFNNYIIEMYPYLMTIIILIITYSSRKGTWVGPASLSVPYFREER